MSRITTATKKITNSEIYPHVDTPDWKYVRTVSRRLSKTLKSGRGHKVGRRREGPVVGRLMRKEAADRIGAALNEIKQLTI